eukprot:scaffold5550_cov82-Cyclotella_meneghiniana.AAC.1
MKVLRMMDDPHRSRSKRACDANGFRSSSDAAFGIFAFELLSMLPVCRDGPFNEICVLAIVQRPP